MIAVCVVLAIPTVLWPDGLLAEATYLAGLLVIVVALLVGRYTLSPADRRPWTLITAASASAATGAVVWQVSPLLPRLAGAGLENAFWLAFYPLMIAGVLRMIRARAVPRGVRRAILQDVVVVTGGAAVFTWHVLIVPIVSAAGAVGPWLTAIYVSYPLGDACVFALALILIMEPERRSVAELLLVGSLGLSLPLDYLHVLLTAMAPDSGDGWYMGSYLIVNALLGAAAVHPDRALMTSPSAGVSVSGVQGWRIALLGTAMCGICLSLIFLPETGWRRVPVGLAVVASLVAIMARLGGAVREQERAARSLIHQAHHDQLTGTANRTLLLHELRAAVHEGSPGLVFVDLDRFKTVNDSLGHHAGDEVLLAVARRLEALVRSTDTVARIGGDEFVVLCRGVREGGLEALAQRICDAVCEPVTLDGHEVRIGASVGVLALDGDHRLASEQDDAETVERLVEELLRTADTAMYQAKRSGGGVQIVRHGVAA